MNAAARLVFSSSLLRQLHWLKAAERIDYKLALLVYKCRLGVAPPYLADELSQAGQSESPFHHVVIAVRSAYAAVNYRRPGLSSR